MKQISIQQSRTSYGVFALLMLVFSLIAVAATAQKKYNVEVVSPAAGSTIVKGQMYTVQFKIVNTGTMAIGGMDTLMVGVDCNGSNVMMGGTMSMTGIAPGSSQMFQINNFSYSNFTADNNSSSLCIGVFIPNNTNTGTSVACQSIKLKVSSTGVANVSNNAVVSVYPNPANNSIKVKATDVTDGRLSLYDLSGRVVTTLTTNGTEQTIETSNYPAGAYFYRLTDKQGALLQTGKLIINH